MSFTSILKKKMADKTVLDFKPQSFNLGTPEQAIDYLHEKAKGSDFRMSDAVRIQTGVAEIELGSEEQRIEEKALEKLKEIQEQAYQQAYQLGLDEGHKKAFEKTSERIQSSLNELDQTLIAFKEMKKEILNSNENHFIQLCYHMASKLAQYELKNHNEALVEIIKSAVGQSYDEEKITVQVSDSQFEFIEELKSKTGREIEFLKKITFEKNPELQPGGCVVETNFGEVDAQIGKRIELLWEQIVEHLPPQKPKLVSNG